MLNNVGYIRDISNPVPTWIDLLMPVKVITLNSSLMLDLSVFKNNNN